MEPLLNRERARQVLSQRGLDMLVAMTPENVFYASGFQSLSQWLIRGKRTMVAVAIDGDGRATLIGSGGEMDRPACDPPFTDQVISFDEVTIEPGDEAAWLPEDRRLAAWGTSAGRPATFWDAIRAVLPPAGARVAVDDRDLADELRERFGLETSDGRPVFDEIRLIKMPEEVRRLRRAVEITEDAMSRSMAQLRDGISEIEMGRIFEAELLSLGGQPYLTCIGFGAFGAYPNHIPGPHRLERGHLIRWDVGCTYQGYACDVARTSIWGQPSELQIKRWRAALAGQLAALAEVRPGAQAAEVYRVGMETARQSGLPEIRRKHFGHGIGIDMYEPPMMSPSETLTILPGMVFNVEVVFYEFGFGALQIEDTLHITDDGYDCLTRLPRRLFGSDA